MRRRRGLRNDAAEEQLRREELAPAVTTAATRTFGVIKPSSPRHARRRRKAYIVFISRWVTIVLNLPIPLLTSLGYASRFFSSRSTINRYFD
jgi:hypothetical protein